MLPSMPILFGRESQDVFGNNFVPNANLYVSYQASNEGNTNEQTSQEASQKKTTPTISAKRKLHWKDKLPTESEGDIKELNFVNSYFEKVQSRFASNAFQPSNKFVQFRCIINDFDPYKSTPIELYKKVKILFGEENKDLTEDFLLFLTPGQAAQVGRFMDYMTLTKMKNFFGVLQSTFARKPTMLRKVIRAIKNSLNCGDFEQLRTRILPHLRSSPRLINMFKSLFPDERPPDSWYETNTDTFNESFLTNDKRYDVWEFEEPNENRRNINVKDGVDTMYLQGRVFLQHGTTLRAARVTFPNSEKPFKVHARRLAPAHYRFSPPESDEERSSPKRNTAHSRKVTTNQNVTKRPRNQRKSPCVRNLIKDVNDNNKHITKAGTEVRTNSAQANESSIQKCLKLSKQSRSSPNNQSELEKNVLKARLSTDKKTSLSDKKERSKGKCKVVRKIGARENIKKDTKQKSKNFVNKQTKHNEGNLTKQAQLEIEMTHESKLNNKIGLASETKTETVKSKQTKINQQLKHEFKVTVDNKTEENNKLKQIVLKNKPQDSEKKVSNVYIDTKCKWTRDEDKTMLQVLKGEAGSDQIFGRIRELLPHRSMVEIKERFLHVMNLLQEMALDEVT